MTKKFKYFPFSNKTGNMCMECLNTPDRGDTHCKECSILLLPFAITIDIIILPFRGFKYLYKK